MIKRIIALAALTVVCSAFGQTVYDSKSLVDTNSTSVSTINTSNVNSGTVTNINDTTVNSSSNNVNSNTNVSTGSMTNTNINSGDMTYTNNNVSSGSLTNNNNNVNSGSMTYNNNNVNSGTTTNNNNNVNTSASTTASTNANTNTNINSGSMTNNNVNSGDMTNRNINTNEITQRIIQPPPTAAAPSMMSGGNADLCTTGTSGAVQTQIFGVSSGGTVKDMNCERLKLSKTLYDMGMKVAAVATMCQDRRVFDAMMAAGTPCPYEGKIGEAAKTAWQENADKVPQLEKENNNENIKNIGLGAMLGAIVFKLF